MESLVWIEENVCHGLQVLQQVLVSRVYGDFRWHPLWGCSTRL